MKLGYCGKKMAMIEEVLIITMASMMIILLLWPAVSASAQSGTDQDLKYRYGNLPPDLQAQCALVKLDHAIRGESGGSQSKLQHLRQGRRWLTEAIARYGEYMGPPNQTFPTTTRLTQPLDPAASPFGLLTHLWLTKEGMIHYRDTNRLFGDTSNLSSERAKAQEKAINDAIDAMQKAVAEVEASREWTAHSDGMFLSLQVPPGFKTAQNPDYRLYLTWSPSQGRRSVEKAVFVSVMPNEDNLQPYEHQTRAIAREPGRAC